MNKFYHNKKGSLLIMSLLILSSLLIIGASVGTIVLNQLRQSRNTDFAIVSYYAADSAIEDVLYKIRKLGQSVGDLNSSDYQGDFNDDSSWTWERDIASTTPFFVFLKKNRPVVINLYDSKTDCGLVRRTRFHWRDPTPDDTTHPLLEVTYYAWNITGSLNLLYDEGDQEYYDSIADNLVNPSLPNGPWHATNTLISLMDDTCYTIRIKALYEDANLFVRTYKDFNAQELIGIPSYLTIESLGKYKTSKQRVKTIILKESPLSNLFEFVLFSEDPISK